MSTINHVTLEPSTYRDHFKLLGGNRWKITFYLVNEIYVEGFDDIEHKFDKVDVHFTAPTYPDTPQEAFKAFLSILEELIKYSDLTRETSDYSAFLELNNDSDVSITDKGFIQFVKDNVLELGVEHGGTDIESIVQHLEELKYYYYSAMKLLAITTSNALHKDAIVSCKADLIDLINNPVEVRDNEH